jgi:hypothetical protein
VIATLLHCHIAMLPGKLDSMHKRFLVFGLLICAATAAMAQATPPKPQTLTPADIQKLKWIEGSWRGTGGGVPPFFERYRLEESALVVESLENGKVTSTSRFELRNGELWVTNGSSVATVFDDKGITFEFVQRNRGSYRWEHVSADQWKAILKWPASEKREAGERIYTMERQK